MWEEEQEWDREKREYREVPMVKDISWVVIS